mmetsp:Transcript_30486/g.46171  ORF Transcript_30486/g.46171 Transcript_30486/m.46171 type:complete len:264 (-) Transcript_30486:10-801(-)
MRRRRRRRMIRHFFVSVRRCGHVARQRQSSFLLLLLLFLCYTVRGWCLGRLRVSSRRQHEIQSFFRHQSTLAAFLEFGVPFAFDPALSGQMHNPIPHQRSAYQHGNAQNAHGRPHFGFERLPVKLLLFFFFHIHRSISLFFFLHHKRISLQANRSSQGARQFSNIPLLMKLLVQELFGILLPINRFQYEFIRHANNSIQHFPTGKVGLKIGLGFHNKDGCPQHGRVQNSPAFIVTHSFQQNKSLFTNMRGQCILHHDFGYGIE